MSTPEQSSVAPQKPLNDADIKYPSVGERFVGKGNYRNPVLKLFRAVHNKMQHVLLLPYKFIVKKVLGEGAFGVVVACLDTETNTEVAVKMICNVFQECREHQKRLLREIKVLKHFSNKHKNIMSLKWIVPPRSYDTFEDVYLVTELMPQTLRHLVKSNTTITEQEVSYFIYQILKGLKYIHSANVLHRDLKPANILLDEELTLKICDFGLSRADDVDGPTPTLYVVTRYYRSPELLLNYENSSKPMDIWSVGCILGEMLGEPKRKVMFTGENRFQQINAILDGMGTPKEEDIYGSDDGTKYLKRLPFRKDKSFREMYPNASDHAIDLLNKMLSFNPYKRITVDEALNHPFFKGVRDPEEELVCPVPFTYNLESDVPTKEIKKLLYDEVMSSASEEKNQAGDAIILDEDDIVIHVPSQFIK